MTEQDDTGRRVRGRGRRVGGGGRRGRAGGPSRGARVGRPEQRFERGGDVPRRELGVRARGDRDLVLAGGVDDDQRDARRRGHAGHVGDVDALGSELGDGGFAQLVGADRADERDRRPHPRRGDGLVGRLAAAVLGEPAARHGLAGDRQP
jgi:hypothetical protein